MFITDPSAPLVIDQSLLRTAYGLTPAEIRAAEALASGLSVEEVAKMRGVQVSTVRSQLKQIYAKTGVDTRARFVKLMHALAAG